ncbi:hypothetical protein V490_01582 [Pseudogymnoascus sp. VKM F-3557]|nr:hypothetical protein V490_01582 [Pseudogymnoascus sp. VKM F-3557]
MSGWLAAATKNCEDRLGGEATGGEYQRGGDINTTTDGPLRGTREVSLPCQKIITMRQPSEIITERV